MTEMAQHKVQCTSCCECGRRLLGYVRGGTFFYQLGDYEILEKDSVLC
jgi:hypothetical protein